jgi:tetratricopeptide (TPR) repeat protein
MKTMGAQRGKKPEYPIHTADSNAAVDGQARLLHLGLACLAVVLTVGILVWSGGQIFSATTSHPFGWAQLVVGILGLGVSFLVGRSLGWLSFFGPIMLAAKNKAWASQESLCRKAISLSKFFPAGGSTAALLLVQSLVSRGQFDEALAIGEEQYEKGAKSGKLDENLAPLYSSLAMANQMRGDFKQSILWSDRSIESFSKALENFSTKKTIVAKIASLQGPQVVGTLKIQLAVAYFNSASSYFNMQNHRQAKASFQKAVEFAQQAPDFPEKSDMLRFSREQLARMKHV